jgi:hypothetical protein
MSVVLAICVKISMFFPALKQLAENGEIWWKTIGSLC